MINRNTLKHAMSGKCLYTNSGIAKILETLSNNQFSTLRLANNHMPAHAVADTHASHAGTAALAFVNTI